MISPFGILGGEGASDHEQYFLRVFHRALRKALLGPLPWILLSLAFMIGAFVVFALYPFQNVPSALTLCALLSSLGVVGVILAIKFMKSLWSLSLLLAMYSVLLSSWWFILFFTGVLPGYEHLLLLFLIFSTLAFIPIVGLPQEVAYAILLGGAVFLLLSNYLILPGFVLMLLGVVGFRNAASLGLERLVSTGALSLLRMRGDLDEPLLRSLMLEGLFLLFRVTRFGVVQEGDPSLFCSRLKNSWVASHHTPISEVAPEILRLEGEAGIIRSTAMGYEFSLRVREVFGYGVDKLAFFSLGNPLEVKRVRIFFPMGTLFGAVGEAHGFRLALLYFLVVTETLQHSHAREQGSTRYRETSALLDEQRADLHHIIHLVNNVTQELSLDGIALERGADDLKSPYIEEVEDSLHALAAEVSDFRLARELPSLFEQATPQESYLLNFQSAMHRYANALSRRFAASFDLDLCPLDETVFFHEDEAVVLLLCRTLMKLTVSEYGSTKQFFLSTHLEHGRYLMEFGEVGGGSESKPLRSRAYRRLSSVERRVVVLVEDLSQDIPFLTVDGSMQRGEGYKAFTVSFRTTEHELAEELADSHRVLFVDDNEQILNIYGRIAGALQLSFQTAPSIVEALAAIEEKGGPSLLVMDLQLADGTGAELLSQVLEEVDNIPSLLVISGEDAQQFQSLQTTFPDLQMSFLGKPVSQQLLIQSIQKLLSSNGDPA